MWWRWDGWPTAAEWQAWWGFAGVLVAGILLYAAWKQLSGLAESNRELKRSNEILAESNKALSRPVVIVEYLLERHTQRDYSSSRANSTVYVVIRNVGPSPARDVVFNGSPQFQRAGNSVSDASIEYLNELFSGERAIKMITPGQVLKYALDDARDALGSDVVPREYAVQVSYTDLQRTEDFVDEFVLQMSHWGPSVAEDAPMKRISKDIQFLSQTLRDANRGIPKLAQQLGQIRDAIPAKDSRGDL